MTTATGYRVVDALTQAGMKRICGVFGDSPNRRTTVNTNARKTSVQEPIPCRSTP